MSPEHPPTRERARARATVLSVLVVLCMVAGVAAVWAGVSGTAADPDDHAHVDASATKQVTGELDEAVTTVLSYDHTDPGRTRRAAERVLGGAALREHRATFQRAAAQARQDGTTRSTTVRSVGLRALRDGRAEALVVADQRTLDEAMRPQSSTQLWIRVVAVHTDGGWRIIEMAPV